MKWTKRKAAVALAVVALATIITVLFVKQRLQSEDPQAFASTRELSGAEIALYAKLSGMTPSQAAETFFDALRRRDAVIAAKFWSSGNDHSQQMFKRYGGMTIIRLGKPFKATFKEPGNPQYNGVYVPYEVQLKDGTVKTWQVALALDRATRRWYWDGGM